MSDQQVVAMFELHGGTPRDEEYREALAAALPDAEVGGADDVGVFEIELEAEDREAALEAVWDAVAAAGADDHIVFLEHPDIPGHYKSGSPE